MSVVDKFRKYKTQKRFEKQLEIMEDPNKILRKDKYADDDFLMDMAGYFSVCYNAAKIDYDATQNEEKLDNWVKYIGKLYGNYKLAVDAYCKIMEDRKEEIKEAFSYEGIDDLDYRLYEKDKGTFAMQLLDDINNKDKEYPMLSDYVNIDACKELASNNVGLLNTFAQAINNVGLRLEGETFRKGDVVAINKSDYDKFRQCINQMGTLMYLDENSTDEDIKDAMGYYKNNFGKDFDIDKLIKEGEITLKDGETKRDATIRNFQDLSLSYVGYSAVLANLDCYDNITIDGNIIMRNCDFDLYVYNGLMDNDLSHEIDLVAFLLERNNCKITYPQVQKQQYLNMLKEDGVPNEYIGRYFQFVDENGKTKPANLNELMVEDNEKKPNKSTTTKSNTQKFDDLEK